MGLLNYFGMGSKKNVRPESAAVGPSGPGPAPPAPQEKLPPPYLIPGTHYYKAGHEYIGEYITSNPRIQEFDGKKMMDLTIVFVDKIAPGYGSEGRQSTFNVPFFDISNKRDDEIPGIARENILNLYEETTEQYNARIAKDKAIAEESQTWTPEIEEARRRAKLAEEENALRNLENARKIKNAEVAKRLRNLAAGGSRRRQSSRARKTRRNRNRKNRRQ